MNPVQKPVRIGNSKGTVIPSKLIRTYHLERGFVFKPMQDGILIQPVSDAKLTLAESFAAMAQDQADLQDALEWAEAGLSDGL
jgi:antitoxin component of MazEF toxin-antitoxin module